MSRLHQHAESHLVARIGWLRAAVLGANDGIVSTASLIVGVAAAATKPGDVLIAGVAGLVAGAMSMAAGEYVSVSSQSDTEQADLDRERGELSQNVAFEEEELAQIYVQRGVETSLARQVAQQLMTKDALGAHARDELGISEITTARPIQAAFTSAATFSVGAALPLLMVLITPTRFLVAAVSAASLLFLSLLGSDRRTSRWRRCHQSDSACDVLGCFRHGPDGRRWSDIWHGGVIGPTYALRSQLFGSIRCWSPWLSGCRLTLEPPLTGYVVALGIGLLLGIERERRKGEGPSRSPAGIRTFAISALLGAIAIHTGGEIAFSVAIAGVAGFTALAYYRSRER